MEMFIYFKFSDLIWCFHCYELLLIARECRTTTGISSADQFPCRRIWWPWSSPITTSTKPIISIPSGISPSTPDLRLKIRPSIKKKWKKILMMQISRKWSDSWLTANCLPKVCQWNRTEDIGLLRGLLSSALSAAKTGHDRHSRFLSWCHGELGSHHLQVCSALHHIDHTASSPFICPI